MGISPRAIGSESTVVALTAEDSPPPPPPCQGEGGRGWIGAEKRGSGNNTLDIYAIKGNLTTKDPPIACEDTGVTFRAASAAWINVSEEAKVFAQMGWAKERAEGNTNDTRFIYCELSWGPNQATQYKLWKFQDPGSVAHNYRIELNRTTGVWTYYLDDSPLTLNPAYPEAAKERMKLFTGFGGRWAGEVVDTKSRMPGTNSSRQIFSDCNFKNDSGPWQAANFVSWDPTPSTKWSNRIANTRTVEIWDTR